MTQFQHRIDSRLGPLVETNNQSEQQEPGNLQKVLTLSRWCATYSQELGADASAAATNNEALRNARARIIELKAAVDDAAQEIEKVTTERGLPAIKV